MVNYSQGKVYKIAPINECDSSEDDIYIGSTCEKYLSQRFAHHKNDYNRWKAGRGPKFSSFDLFESYGVERCEILLIENVNAKNKEELITILLFIQIFK